MKCEKPDDIGELYQKEMKYLESKLKLKRHQSNIEEYEKLKKAKKKGKNLTEAKDSP